MRCHRNCVIRTVFIGLLTLFLLSSAYVKAEPLKLVLVLSEKAGAYLEYGNALREKLANRNVSLHVVDAEQLLPDSDMVIAAGLKAALSVAHSKPVALLVVLLPKEGYKKLLSDFPAQAKVANSAIYLDQPFKRQLSLISALLPQANSIGLLYTSPPKEMGLFRMQAIERKFYINERAVASASDLHSALQEVLVGSDVLLALPDADIYNTSTIRNILLSTYRSRVPLIGFSAAYVRAGALAAVFSTAEQFAEQSVGIIQDYVATHTLPTAQYAKEFEVSVNEQVARSLQLDIKSAAQLRAEIGTTP